MLRGGLTSGEEGLSKVDGVVEEVIGVATDTLLLDGQRKGDRVLGG